MNPTNRIADGKQIPGTLVKAFIHNFHYYLTDIKVYQDGMIDCWELVDIETFKERVRQGWVVTHLPEGARVGISSSNIYFTATNVQSNVDEQELVKEVEDEIQDLNGEPTSFDLCWAALEAYRSEKSPEAKEKLRQAYIAVPKHLRMYLGDMDAKDSELRSILNIWT